MSHLYRAPVFEWIRSDAHSIVRDLEFPFRKVLSSEMENGDILKLERRFCLVNVMRSSFETKGRLLNEKNVKNFD